MTKALFEKIKQGAVLSKEDAVELLKTDNTSNDFYRLISIANEQSRRQYEGKGYIFAQIGINSAPCSGNCKFCSLAKDNFSVDIQTEKDAAQVIGEAKAIAGENVEALFLMTTADYDKEKFMTIGKAVKAVLPEKLRLIANIGDFDAGFAKRLKEAGFSGAYHVARLREGVDTSISRSTRLATLDAIKTVGLDLYYCIEPIGSEHTYDEIADEMIRAREYNVDVMAVMGRVNVRGTAFEHETELSGQELTKIAAVTRIVTNPGKSMNIHEPTAMPLLAGVNQLYAEFGVNPRDNNSETEKNRGFNIQRVKKMLIDAGYIL